MKSVFNTSWKGSVQPRKQRKYLANAPNHLKRKQLSVNLDKPLRTKYGQRSIAIRKNDEVKVMKGKFKKKQGKVLNVDAKYTRVQVEGVEITKKDGEKSAVWVRPANLKIIKLDDSDKKRMKKIPQKVEKKSEEKKQIKENKSIGEKNK
jgi:large subunit ribosomal protein L24